MTASDCEVLVVGGGVAGLSLLHALTERGVCCLLIDRARSGGSPGASWLPAALLNPHRGRTGRASALDRAGLEAFWRLARRLEAAGLDSGARRTGVLRAASSARQQALWSGLDGPLTLEAAGFPAHFRARFGGMLVPDGGWVEPARLLAALKTAAVAGGAAVLDGVELLAPGRGQLGATSGVAAATTVATSTGTVTARHVVLCLGAYDADACRLPRLELAPGLAIGFDVDVEGLSGRNAAASLSTVGLGTESDAAAAGSAGAGLRPLAGAIGIVFTDRGVVVSGAAHSGDEVDVERLRSSAAWFMPALTEAPVTSVWRGVRARRPSGVPVARQVRRGVTLFGGLGGRGFLCGPLLADRLAERVTRRLQQRR